MKTMSFGALALALGSSVVSAQCVQWTSPWGGFAGADDPMDACRAYTGWRPSGLAPSVPYVVVTGAQRLGGLGVNGIGAWDGSEWRSFGSGVNGTVSSVVAWDPDGAGPDAEWLVAAGDLNVAGGQPANGVAAWDGSAWIPLGRSSIRSCTGVGAFDPDGVGPAARQLVALGLFVQPNGTTRRGAARWDGTTWVTFGPLATQTGDVVTFDPDGGGALGEQIVLRGSFVDGSGTPLAAPVVWNGTSVVTLGAGLSGGGVFDYTVFDADGDGALPPRLVALGTFTSSGATPLAGLAQWDGAQWTALSTSMLSLPGRLGSWDPDGSGASPPELVASHSVTGDAGTSAEIVRLQGGVWVPLGTRLVGAAVWSVEGWDHDGDAATPERLLIAGELGETDGYLLRGVATWDGEHWVPVGRGLNDAPSTITTWDPDGSGSGATWLLAVGDGFRAAGGEYLGRAAGWDGAAWHSLNGPSRVSRILTWQSAADAGAPETLVASGLYRPFQPGAIAFPAAWDGANWNPIGGGVTSASGSSVSIAFPSPVDDTGRERLLVGGRFDSAGGVPANNVAVWDGQQWSALGDGLGRTANGDSVSQLMSWDPDGAGPESDWIVAIGSFTSAEAPPAIRNFAVWNGQEWAPLGTIEVSTASAVASWDPDGAGPLPAWIVLSGQALIGNPPQSAALVAWDGTAWRRFFSDGEPPSSTFPLRQWDPDGAGPEPESLFGTRVVTEQSPSNASRVLVRFNGTTWERYGRPINAFPFTQFEFWDRDPADGEPGSLVIAGEFTHVGGAPIGGIAFGNPGSEAPEFTLQPGSAPLLYRGDDVTMSVATRAGAERLRWRRNGADLVRGATPWGSEIPAVDGPTLRILNAQFPDAGVYECVAENGCGVTVSAPATVSFWIADATEDGVVNSTDFFYFLNRFLTQSPETDVDGNGVVNSQDFYNFLMQFFATP